MHQSQLLHSPPLAQARPQARVDKSLVDVLCEMGIKVECHSSVQ